MVRHNHALGAAILSINKRLNYLSSFHVILSKILVSIQSTLRYATGEIKEVYMIVKLNHGELLDVSEIAFISAMIGINDWQWYRVYLKSGHTLTVYDSRMDNMSYPRNKLVDAWLNELNTEQVQQEK
jgi:hypothetical protein